MGANASSDPFPQLVSLPGLEGLNSIGLVSYRGQEPNSGLTLRGSACGRFGM